jgi:hypothetical protein
MLHMSINNARKSRTVIPAGSAYAGYEYKVESARVNPALQFDDAWQPATGESPRAAAA